MNKFIETNYTKWSNYAKVITNNKESEDLLHNFIIVIIEKNIPQFKLTDNYVFISLKNTFLTRIKKTNKVKHETIGCEERRENPMFELRSTELTKEELEEITIQDFILQNKLDIITKTILSLNEFERKLYQLHFIYGLSQRRIARDINVSHLTINQRINKIKQKIKDNYEN